jgi:nitrite reductase (NADH) large subunit
MTDNQDRKECLVVVGNGMAGMRTVEELLRLAPDRYKTTVFGAEPHGNYNRILLSPVLAGEKTLADIVTHPPEWYVQNGVGLIAGDPVVDINRALRTVTTRSGHVAHYDKLLLATGSTPFIPPFPGSTLPGVVGFRTIEDVDLMLKAAQHYRHAIVIGGGVLGLEAACALRKQGMKATVIHRMAWLMERQLDPTAASLLQKTLERRGIQFELSADTRELSGDWRVREIVLQDGRRLPTDLVVVTAGIMPQIALAKASGLRCERGVVVDDAMRSSDPTIYAVGECAQHRGACYGLVAPLWEQATVCATQLAGTDESAAYTGSVLSTRLKVTGVNVFSAGDFIGEAGTERLVFSDPRRGVYKKLVLRDGMLAGAVLYGEVGDGGWYFDLMRSRQSVAALRNKLVFGRGFAEVRAA